MNTFNKDLEFYTVISIYFYTVNPQQRLTLVGPPSTTFNLEVFKHSIASSSHLFT